jgi:hypothetical protein
MNLAWLAQVVFFGAYFIAWLSNQMPHTGWGDATAIAAVVIAVLLLVDNGPRYWGNHNHPVA